MSKTVEIQIEKCRNLVEGLNKHLNGNGSGVNADEIAAMKKAMEELQAANLEVETLREELAPKVKRTNQLLEQVKNLYLEKKALIKSTYPQEKWLEYGVPDKR